MSPAKQRHLQTSRAKTYATRAFGSTDARCDPEGSGVVDFGDFFIWPAASTSTG